jgi:DNA (cytosine-5)-methyltransferase 1
MRYLSVCSGVEAATVAWHGLGWQPVAFSEIEKFPSQVLAHHYSDVPNLGDMTKYKEWNFGTSGLDLLVGGTPCQSFSVAGLRKGLEDPRGNLALVYCGILDKFRPKWFVWENVPGVLSSGKGRDFGSFLGALAELGYGWSYRVLDAQHFGVPQRRKRVFVVGHLGDWRHTAKVLFESSCLQGNIKQSRQKREEVAKCLTTGIGTRNDAETDQFVYKGVGAIDLSNTSKTLTASYGTGGPDLDIKPLVLDIAYGFEPGIAKREGSPNRFVEEMSPTLRANMGDNQVATAGLMAVRRLTPVECERLQGFPDNYTNIRENCPDGPRYKAMGNSMAVPVMRWIGERIKMVEESQ